MSFRSVLSSLKDLLAQNNPHAIASLIHENLCHLSGDTLLAYLPPSSTSRAQVSSGSVAIALNPGSSESQTISLISSDVRKALALSDALRLDECACVELLVKSNRERSALTVESAAGIHLEERQAAVACIRVALQASLFDLANAAAPLEPVARSLLDKNNKLIKRLCALIRNDDAVSAGVPVDAQQSQQQQQQQLALTAPGTTPVSAHSPVGHDKPLTHVVDADGSVQSVTSIMQHERAALCECLLLACAAAPAHPSDVLEIDATLKLLVSRWHRYAKMSAESAQQTSPPVTNGGAATNTSATPWLAFEVEAEACMNAALMVLLSLSACLCPPALDASEDVSRPDVQTAVRAILDDAAVQKNLGFTAAVDGTFHTNESPQGCFAGAALLVYALARWRDSVQMSDAEMCEKANRACLRACERGAVQLFADTAVPMLCGVGSGAVCDSLIRTGLGTQARAAAHTLDALISAEGGAAAARAHPPLWCSVEPENTETSTESLRSKLCGTVAHVVLAHLSSTPVIAELQSICASAPPVAPPAAPMTGAPAPSPLSGGEGKPHFHAGWFETDAMRAGSPVVIALAAMDDRAPGVGEPLDTAGGDCFHAVLRFAESIFNLRPELAPHVSIATFLNWVASLSDMPASTISYSEQGDGSSSSVERPKVVTAAYVRVLAAFAGASSAPGSSATGARKVFDTLLTGSSDSSSNATHDDRVSWLRLYRVLIGFDNRFAQIEADKKEHANPAAMPLAAARGTAMTIDAEVMMTNVMSDEDADVLCAYLLCLRRCLEGAPPNGGAGTMVEDLTRTCCSNAEHPAEPLARLLPRPCPPRVKASLMECVAAFSAAGEETAIGLWMRMSDLRVAGGDTLGQMPAASWGGTVAASGTPGTASVGGVAYELAVQESREGLYPVTIAALRAIRTLLAVSDGKAIDAAFGASSTGNGTTAQYMMTPMSDSGKRSGAEALLRFPWAAALRGWSRRVHHETEEKWLVAKYALDSCTMQLVRAARLPSVENERDEATLDLLQEIFSAGETVLACLNVLAHSAQADAGAMASSPEGSSAGASHAALCWFAHNAAEWSKAERDGQWQYRAAALSAAAPQGRGGNVCRIISPATVRCQRAAEAAALRFLVAAVEAEASAAGYAAAKRLGAAAAPVSATLLRNTHAIAAICHLTTGVPAGADTDSATAALLAETEGSTRAEVQRAAVSLIACLASVDGERLSHAIRSSQTASAALIAGCSHAINDGWRASLSESWASASKALARANEAARGTFAFQADEHQPAGSGDTRAAFVLDLIAESILRGDSYPSVAHLLLGFDAASSDPTAAFLSPNSASGACLSCLLDIVRDDDACRLLPSLVERGLRVVQLALGNSMYQAPMERMLSSLTPSPWLIDRFVAVAGDALGIPSRPRCAHRLGSFVLADSESAAHLRVRAHLWNLAAHALHALNSDVPTERRILISLLRAVLSEDRSAARGSAEALPVTLQALAHLKHLTASIPPPEECFAHGRIASDASILAVVTDPAVDVIRLLRDPVDAERGGVRRASATRMPGRQGSFTPLLLDPGAVSVELLRRLRSAAASKAAEPTVRAAAADFLSSYAAAVAHREEATVAVADLHAAWCRCISMLFARGNSLFNAASMSAQMPPVPLLSDSPSVNGGDASEAGEGKLDASFGASVDRHAEACLNVAKLWLTVPASASIAPGVAEAAAIPMCEAALTLGAAALNDNPRTTATFSLQPASSPGDDAAAGGADAAPMRAVRCMTRSLEALMAASSAGASVRVPLVTGALCQLQRCASLVFADDEGTDSETMETVAATFTQGTPLTTPPALPAPPSGSARRVRFADTPETPQTPATAPNRQSLVSAGRTPLSAGPSPRTPLMRLLGSASGGAATPQASAAQRAIDVVARHAAALVPALSRDAKNSSGARELALLACGLLSELLWWCSLSGAARLREVRGALMAAQLPAALAEGLRQGEDARLVDPKLSEARCLLLEARACLLLRFVLAGSSTSDATRSVSAPVPLAAEGARELVSCGAVPMLREYGALAALLSGSVGAAADLACYASPLAATAAERLALRRARCIAPLLRIALALVESMPGAAEVQLAAGQLVETLANNLMQLLKPPSALLAPMSAGSQGAAWDPASLAALAADGGPLERLDLCASLVCRVVLGVGSGAEARRSMPAAAAATATAALFEERMTALASRILIPRGSGNGERDALESALRRAHAMVAEARNRAMGGLDAAGEEASASAAVAATGRRLMEVSAAVEERLDSLETTLTLWLRRAVACDTSGSPVTLPTGLEEVSGGVPSAVGRLPPGAVLTRGGQPTLVLVACAAASAIDALEDAVHRQRHTSVRRSLDRVEASLDALLLGVRGALSGSSPRRGANGMHVDKAVKLQASHVSLLDGVLASPLSRLSQLEGVPGIEHAKSLSLRVRTELGDGMERMGG